MRIDPRPGPWDDCFGMVDGVQVVLTWPSLSLVASCRWTWTRLQERSAAVSG